MGAGVLKQIRKYQKSVELLCSKAAFNRLIRRCGEKELERRGRETETLRWQELAILCIQTAAEQFVLEVMQDAYKVSLIARRCTLMRQDMRVARNVRRDYENDHAQEGGRSREIDEMIIPPQRPRPSKKARK